MTACHRGCREDTKSSLHGGMLLSFLLIIVRTPAPEFSARGVTKNIEKRCFSQSGKRLRFCKIVKTKTLSERDCMPPSRLCTAELNEGAAQFESSRSVGKTARNGTQTIKSTSSAWCHKKPSLLCVLRLTRNIP